MSAVSPPISVAGSQEPGRHEAERSHEGGVMVFSSLVFCGCGIVRRKDGGFFFSLWNGGIGRRRTNVNRTPPVDN
jgi:hypothetical protein